MSQAVIIILIDQFIFKIYTKVTRPTTAIFILFDDAMAKLRFKLTKNADFF